MIDNLLFQKKYLFFFLTISILPSSLIAQNSSNQTCPSYSCPKPLCELKHKQAQNFCENVKCMGIEITDCPPGSLYQDRITMCGCCPGCAKFLSIGDKCETYPQDPTQDLSCSGQFCPILMNRCTPGLICPVIGETEKTCSVPKVKDGTEPSCSDRRALGMNNELHWVAACETDGSYSPKQCKGTFHAGTCFCVNREGKRIFGRKAWEQAENQTCACSRQVYELREAGHIASIHCTSDGNYEALQCDTESGLCYCVDPSTGKTTGAVLPENQWRNLPCYSLNVTNGNPEGQYLRNCESEWAMARKIAIEAELHGLKVFSGQTISCDYDGSFAQVQNIGGRAECKTKTGTLIGNNFQEEDLRPMNCQCARDEIYAVEDGFQFTRKCALSSGNYDTISPEGLEEPVYYRCVDQDGFFYGPEEPRVTERYKCCLLGDCSTESDEVKNMCYNPMSTDNENKIYPCSTYNT